MTREDELLNGDGSPSSEKEHPNIFRKIYTQPQFEEMYSKISETQLKTFKQRAGAFTKKAGQKVKEAYCGKRIEMQKYANEGDQEEVDSRSDHNDSSSHHKKQCATLSHGGLGICLLRFFPFISIMRGYDVRNWLANDIIAGFTVGVMNIPQGKSSKKANILIRCFLSLLVLI